jgi:uncharacterized coiled-coil protein SlyX
MSSTAGAQFAAYDAATAVGRGEDQAAYLHAVAVDKRRAVDKIKEQLAGLKDRLKEAQAEATEAERAAREAGAE